jgi:hypothetical protein
VFYIKKGEVLVAFVSENDIMAKVAVFSPPPPIGPKNLALLSAHPNIDVVSPNK